MQTILRSTQGIAPGQSFISQWYPVPSVSIAYPLQMAAGGPAEAAYLSFSIYSDQSGIVTFQETDDSTNQNLIHQVGLGPGGIGNAVYSYVGGTALFQQGILVKRASWRVIVTNTGAAQKTFELCVNQCASQPELFDANGNLLVAVDNSTPFGAFISDPQSLLTAPSLADIWRVESAILRELRISNMLLLKISEPYSSSPVPFNLAEPEGIGVDPN